MVYDEEKDCYRCSQGNLLKAVGSKQRQTASGYIATKVIYKCSDCTDCPVKSRCIKCVLLAISHNIEKLHNKIQHGKTGEHLHCEDKVA